jgi:hypothetical protein
VVYDAGPDDSPEGERAELEGLVNQIREHGAGAFSDYLGDPDKIPCVPVQLLCLRAPDCPEWSGSRLVAVLDGLVAVPD